MDKNNSLNYKKTKIGLIPESWIFRQLREYCSLLTSGVSVNSGDRPIKNGEIGILKTSSVLNGVFYPNENKIILQEKELKRARLNPVKNTLLISRMNTPELVGACAFITETRTELFIPDRLWQAKFDSERINARWLNCLLNTQYYKNQIKNRASGTSNSMKNISKPSFLGLFIPIPPLPEQKRIAEILGTWDKAIETTQKLIDELKLRNKGLAQQLLTGKKRLKGFDGEWEEVQFSDVCNRLTRKNEELDDTVVTISAQKGFVKQEDYFSKRVASETLSGYYLIHNGEFAYNKSISNGYPMGAFKRLDNMEKAVVTTLYICFAVKDSVNSDFMKQFFEAGQMTRNLMRIAQVGGRAHGLLNISISDFFSLKLKVPLLDEQMAITEILSNAEKETLLQQKKLDILKDQKKGLMQKLLTGKVRVKIEET
ncbi:MAG: restriction endonuclease subunit S [Bacteroidia bacterium]